eukprot:6608134-Ditylum_brightwellii.AAC.2
MDPKVRPYADVDLQNLGDPHTPRGRWARQMMGLKPAPYTSVRAFLCGEEMIRGDRRCKANPLHWDRVEQNLPGDSNYNPRIVWVCKVDLLNNHTANAFVTFYDDIRLVGHGEQNCAQVMHRVGSMLNHLGWQDAARKTRPPTEEESGACAGRITRAEKWEQFVKIVLGWWETWQDAKANKKPAMYNHKVLEKVRGFAIYMGEISPMIKPYLKGVNLTLESWWQSRNSEGWKMTDMEWEAHIKEFDSDEELEDPKAPAIVED